MSRFLSNKYKQLAEYVPGEQPQDRKYIKLNTNESPFAPSQGVIDAINEKQVENLRLYCDPECKKLKNAIADLYCVLPENVYVANGSDDILNFAFMAFGQDGVAFPDVSYGFYSVFAELYGIKPTIIPLKHDFTIDKNDYCGQNKLIVIANPNAPTGIALTLTDIEDIIKTNPDNVVLIDEAYVDFGAESVLSLTKKYKNLLCVQTFSKSKSLAGARLGFAVADAQIIADLEKIKYSTNPYNVNGLTQIAGTAAIKENDYYSENAKKIISNREFTCFELEKLGFEFTNSKANFIFAKSNKIGGKALYQALKEKGILVRHFDKERINDYNRITVGSREEMEIFIQKVKEILGEYDENCAN